MVSNMASQKWYQRKVILEIRKLMQKNWSISGIETGWEFGNVIQFEGFLGLNTCVLEQTHM